jgi:phosphoribosylglycinamide formyltransferase 2
LFLGSGELGKEVVIELMRLGAEVIACDRYPHAPAMQVAHRSHVLDMLDADALEAIIRKEMPDLIVPEIEAIATDRLLELEQEGFHVIPTAEAACLTMDREGIRRLAAEELDLPTARYAFASSFEELEAAAQSLGLPVVIKPIMSSSGKGQSVARTTDDLKASWNTAQSGGRAGAGKLIVEEFVSFESEITLLTLRSTSGTLYCDPIGHRQEGGDYVESWQPHPMSSSQLRQSKDIAKAVTDRLGGLGIYGVELFLLSDGRVLFSEVSPRPHDTGLVTIASQVWSEFALHARAILGLPVATITRHSIAASAAIKATEAIQHPTYHGLDRVFGEAGIDVRIFGKPNATPGRRMAVCLATGRNVQEALAKAKAARERIRITNL